MESGRTLFEQDGFAATTIEELAHRADISRATFFNYFTGKEHLLHAIALAELDDLASRAAAGEASGRDPWMILEATMVDLVSGTFPCLRLTRAVVHESSREAGPDINPLTVLKSMLTRQAARAWVCPPDRPSPRCRHAATMLMGIYLDAVLSPGFQISNGETTEQTTVASVRFALDLLRSCTADAEGGA